MSAPHMLCEIISEDVRLILVEPGIYSIYSPGVSPGSYDTIGASMIYDLVACKMKVALKVKGNLAFIK